MKRTSLGYFCIVLLGISTWPLPAHATPTCDEITSAQLCTVPEILVTAPRNAWIFGGPSWQRFLDQLSIQEALRFSEMAAATIRSQLPDSLSDIPDSKIERRKTDARTSADNRQLLQDITEWYIENGPSCAELALHVSTLGVIVSAAGGAHANFPMFTTGLVITIGAQYTQYYVCE